MDSDAILNLEAIEFHPRASEVKSPTSYTLYMKSCPLCQCDGLEGKAWVRSGCRLVFGQDDRFHGSTAPFYQYRTLFSKPPHGISDLFIVVHCHRDATATHDSRQAFIMHEECFQYLQTILRRQRRQYGPLIHKMLWLLGLSTSLSWAMNDNANENRAQLSVEDSMLDRPSLALQAKIAASKDSNLATTLTKISHLTDELVLRISGHLPLADHARYHSQYARLAIVFSQASSVMNYIYQQMPSSPTLKPSISLPEVDFSKSGEVHYSTLRFGGQNYFTRLENSPFPGSNILEKDENWDRVVVATDMVGITGVLLINTREYLRKRRAPQFDGLGRWYRVAGSSKTRYKIEYKGIFIIALVPERLQPHWSFLLDTPDHFLEHVEDLPNNKGAHLYQTPRHKAKLSEGLVVLWPSFQRRSNRCWYIIRTIQDAPNVLVPELNYNAQHHKYNLHLYFPLSRDERIAQAWALTNSEGGQPILSIRTTFGREKVFGPSFEMSSTRQASWPLFNDGCGPVNTLVYAANTSKRHAEIWDSDANVVGLGSYCDSSTSTKIAVMKDQSRKPGIKTSRQSSMGPPMNRFGSPLSTFDNEEFHGDPNQDWFYSYASLAGVQGVQTCTDVFEKEEGILGMLLHFSDRKEVVGQWRLDLNMSEVVEMPTRIFLWQYRFSRNRKPSVNVIVDNTASFAITDARRVHLPGAEILEGMEEIGMQKSLVWWFGSYGNVVEVRS